MVEKFQEYIFKEILIFGNCQPVDRTVDGGVYTPRIAQLLAINLIWVGQIYSRTRFTMQTIMMDIDFDKPKDKYL